MQTALLGTSSTRMDANCAEKLHVSKAVHLCRLGPGLRPKSQALNNTYQAEAAGKHTDFGPCNLSEPQFPHL